MTQPFKLIMISAAMEQSGNIFLRMLDGHPNLACYSFESQIGTTLSKSLLDNALGSRYRYPVFDSEWGALDCYSALQDEELKTYLQIPNRSKFRDCGIEMKESERIAWFVDWYRKLKDDDIPQRKRAIMAYFASTFDAWKNYNRNGQETHYVGYNPSLVLEADKFFEDFPDGHLIHVMRNPFSGYSDTLKRPYVFSRQRYCDIWNVCQMKAATMQIRYPNFHVIKNEDYVRDPVGVIGGLLESIGIPSSPTLAYPSFNGKKLDNLMPWGAVEHPSEEYNQKKAGELSQEDFTWINQETKAMLEYWDYAAYAFRLYKKFYERGD